MFMCMIFVYIAGNCQGYQIASVVNIYWTKKANRAYSTEGGCPYSLCHLELASAYKKIWLICPLQLMLLSVSLYESSSVLLLRTDEKDQT